MAETTEFLTTLYFLNLHALPERLYAENYNVLSADVIVYPR